MDKLPASRAPDVNTFVKTSAGQVLPVRREGHAVDRLLVPRESVDAAAALHVPQTDRRVEGGAGQDQVASKTLMIST